MQARRTAIAYEAAKPDEKSDSPAKDMAVDAAGINDNGGVLRETDVVRQRQAAREDGGTDPASCPIACFYNIFRIQT